MTPTTASPTSVPATMAAIRTIRMALGSTFGELADELGKTVILSSSDAGRQSLRYHGAAHKITQTRT